MQHYFRILVGLALLIASCKGKSDKQAPVDDSTTVQPRYSWEAGLNDSTGRLEMKKKEGIGPDSISAAAVINFVNTKYPNVQLVFSGLSGDTMHLKIPEAMYLTQQMGSTGPTLYFAEAVYNLTEIPGVKYVHFDFEEGDHASPETLGRESFKDE